MPEDKDTYRSVGTVLRLNRLTKKHKKYLSSFYDLCVYLTESSNNLYNSTNFYFRQGISGINKLLDNKLPSKNECEAIVYVNTNLDSVETRLNSIKQNIKIPDVISKMKDTKQLPEISVLKRLKPTKYKHLTKDNCFLDYSSMDAVFKESNHENYRALPAQIAQRTLKGYFNGVKSYIESIKKYKKDASSFKSRPNMPGYQDKGGRYVVEVPPKYVDLTYIEPNKKSKRKHGDILLTFHGFRSGGFKNGITFLIKNHKLPDNSKFMFVRIVPNKKDFKIEIVYDTTMKINDVSLNEPTRVLSIDPGSVNFCTITNNFGLEPLIIKGNKIKQINTEASNRHDYYLSILAHGKDPKIDLKGISSHRLESIEAKRQARLNDFIHKASHDIIDYALNNDVDTIVIGHNKNQKQNINLGKKTNRTFYAVPFYKFNSILEYKAKENGINVIITEESYTSKASYLDRDEIPTYNSSTKVNYTFSGKRVYRGMYISKNGRQINADVNGSANIMRKAIPDLNLDGLDICVKKKPKILDPIKSDIAKTKNSSKVYIKKKRIFKRHSIKPLFNFAE